MANGLSILDYAPVQMAADVADSLKRRVREEAGYRCAIPTCRQFPIDVHHIVERAEGGEDVFENLIALCATCHARYHRLKDIPRISIQHYKSSLSLLNARYNETERRLLQLFAEQPDSDEMELSDSLDFHLMYLLRDGLLRDDGVPHTRDERTGTIMSSVGRRRYVLTPRGRDFVSRWLEGRQLD